MGFLESAATGNYAPVGNIHEADYIVGQSFGAGPNGEPGIVNEQSAELIDRLIHENDLKVKLVLQQEMAIAAEHLGLDVDRVIEGDPSTAIGEQLDSWGVLTEGKRFGDTHELEHPMLVTQAFLIGRLTLQATKLGMNPIVPEGLPTAFDPISTQFWTRNQALWVMRELPGSAYLKLRGKL